MTIRPIDVNGTIQRAQDVGSIKQQEDAKPIVDQQNIQHSVAKEERLQQKQVNQAENADQGEYRYDAKDGNQSQYKGQSKKKKKKKETASPGRVIVKGSKSFDIKI